MRSHYCGQLTAGMIGEEVALCGWVHRRRDHAALSLLTCATGKDWPRLSTIRIGPISFALAESLRNEFVIRITGRVRRRPQGTVNPNLPTGEVEVLGHTLEILNKAKTPPFPA